MQLTNHTVFSLASTLCFARDGREVVLAIAKATFTMNDSDEELSVSTDQAPLVKGDEFFGEPGRSAVRYETDFSHFKPQCDVLLNGSAHAPIGALVRWMPVGLQIGHISKAFKVYGERVWESGFKSTRASAPRPFSTMPISFGHAFGGVDDFGDGSAVPDFYMANPVGRGYHKRTSRNLVDGTPLAGTEQFEDPIERPDKHYVPMAFGAMGRNFAARVPHAGTYDQGWLANKAPFWPDDFRYEYFQAAPIDQRTPYPTGGEVLTLKNLTASGMTTLRLPTLDLGILARFVNGTAKTFPMAVDTLLIEPDLSRITMTCRVGIPMAKSVFDVRELILDKAASLEARQQRHGKPHYTSPAEYARARSKARSSA